MTRALPQLDLGRLRNPWLPCSPFSASLCQGQQPCLCQESPWIPNIPSEPAIVWPSVPRSVKTPVSQTLSTIDMDGRHKAVPRRLPDAVLPASHAAAAPSLRCRFLLKPEVTAHSISSRRLMICMDCAALLEKIGRYMYAAASFASA